jgi:hypothetical protein
MSNGLVPPILNPSTLYKEEAKRDATRIRTYNMILTQIYNKVKAAARIPGGDKAIFYVIPEIIPGTPRFDMGDAVLYIVWNLRNVGYFVDYVWPNGLYVNWRAHDEMYRRVESPWTKVMESARSLVLRGEATPTTVSTATPGPPIATPAEIVKRKSVLKKTVEFKVAGEEIPRAANPAVLQGMYASKPVSAPLKLPGQLSEKHVSFV